PGGGGGGAVLPAEQPDGAVFQVAVVQKAPVPLFFRVPPGEVQSQVLEALHQGGGGQQLLPPGLPGDGQAAAQIAQGLLHLLPAALQPLERGVLLLLGGKAAPPPAQGEALLGLPGAVPVPGGGQSGQGLAGLPVLVHGGGEGLLQFR